MKLLDLILSIFTLFSPWTPTVSLHSGGLKS